MRYTNYRDFYNQPTTLPVKGLRGTKIDIPMLFTAFGFLVISAFLASGIYFIFPLDSLLGIHKSYFIVGLTTILVLGANKIDTANYPFFLYIGSILFFLFKRMQMSAIVCFQEVELPVKKWRPTWKIQYRETVERDNELLFFHYPIQGVAKSLKGIVLHFTGSTKVTYHPVEKKIVIDTGSFEKLKTQEKVVHRMQKFKMEVGRGKLQFLSKKGEVVGVYEPITSEKETLN